MKTENLVPVKELCVQYKIEYSFFDFLGEYGLVEIISHEQNYFIQKEHLSDVERLIRLHSDLGINLEGIEAISHLLKKVDELQREIMYLKNRFGDESPIE